MTQATKDLVQYITTAVDANYKRLTPELRKQCDKLTARLARLARVAAVIDDEPRIAGVDATSILAQTDVVKAAVNVSCLIAELAPTPGDYQALCEYVASEAINDARRAAAREKTQIQIQQ